MISKITHAMSVMHATGNVRHRVFTSEGTSLSEDGSELIDMRTTQQAANVSSALMHAFAGNAHEPARTVVLPPAKFVPGPPIRPVAEAFAMAFCGISSEPAHEPVTLPRYPWQTHPLSEVSYRYSN